MKLKNITKDYFLSDIEPNLQSIWVGRYYNGCPEKFLKGTEENPFIFCGYTSKQCVDSSGYIEFWYNKHPHDGIGIVTPEIFSNYYGKYGKEFPIPYLSGDPTSNINIQIDDLYFIRNVPIPSVDKKNASSLFIDSKRDITYFLVKFQSSVKIIKPIFPSHRYETKEI